MRWITQSGDEAGRGRPNTEIVVSATLTGLESVQLDQWVATHLGDVVRVEVGPGWVLLHGPRSPEPTTATRVPGHLADALDDALARL